MLEAPYVGFLFRCYSNPIAFELWSPSTLSGFAEHEFAIMPCSIVRQPDPLDSRHFVPSSDGDQHRRPEDGFGLAAKRATWMKA